MGFGLNDALKVAVPVYGATSLLAGKLGGVGSTSQEAMMTPEQKAAMARLSDFSATGRFGDFKAGEEQNLGYGDFNATGLEMQGQSALQSLLRGGIPDQYRMGDEALKGFLETDPAAIKAQFDPFAAQVQRQIKDSNTALKRGAGFAGNLYSTNTIRNMGDIQARGNETLTAQLANLTNQAADRRMQAIPLAYQSAESQQGAKLQQISASQQYGALTRQLNDASIKARDAEILRRREELKMPIQAAQGIMGTNVNYGVPSVQNQSPYADLLGMVGQIGGAAIGGSFGGPAGAMVGSSVGKSVGGMASNGGGSLPRGVYAAR
jgi:hypothetical protein